MNKPLNWVVSPFACASCHGQTRYSKIEKDKVWCMSCADYTLIPKEIPVSDIVATLAERGARYGRFADHATICQRLKEIMSSTEGWGRLADDQRQALETIMDKVARILNGDPNYDDNWVDIEGYAKLVRDRLQGEKA